MQRPERFTTDRLLLAKKSLEGISTHLAAAQRSIASALTLLHMNANVGVPQSDTELVMRAGLESGYINIQTLIAFNNRSTEGALQCVHAMISAAAPKEPQALADMTCLTEKPQ